VTLQIEKMQRMNKNLKSKNTMQLITALMMDYFTRFGVIISKDNSLTEYQLLMIPINQHQRIGYIRIAKLIFLTGHTQEKLRLKSTLLTLIKHIPPKAENIGHTMRTELLEEAHMYLMYQTTDQANITTGTDLFSE
jgi:hypothetical protein